MTEWNPHIQSLDSAAGPNPAADGQASAPSPSPAPAPAQAPQATANPTSPPPSPGGSHLVPGAVPAPHANMAGLAQLLPSPVSAAVNMAANRMQRRYNQQRGMGSAADQPLKTAGYAVSFALAAAFVGTGVYLGYKGKAPKPRLAGIAVLGLFVPVGSLLWGGIEYLTGRNTPED